MNPRKLLMCKSLNGVKVKTFNQSTIFAALIVLCFQATAQPKIEAQPAMAVGDKWTYKFSNLGDRREPYTFTHQAARLSADSTWIYGESKEPEARRPQFLTRWDNKRAKAVESFMFNAKNPVQPGSRFANWQPQDDFVQFPLEVGKSWKVRFAFNDANVTSRTDYTVEVVAFEKIKVAAGEFDSFVLRGRGYWTCESGCSGSGRAEQTLWYAPAVKREIKLTNKSWTTQSSPWNNNERELIAWEPAAALPATFASAIATEAGKKDALLPDTVLPAAAGPTPK